jgi:hypothetical protein
MKSSNIPATKEDASKAAVEGASLGSTGRFKITRTVKYCEVVDKLG